MEQRFLPTRKGKFRKIERDEMATQAVKELVDNSNGRESDKEEGVLNRHMCGFKAGMDRSTNRRSTFFF